MTKKPNSIPISQWALWAAPSDITHYHRRALQLALEGRIAGAVLLGVEPRKSPTKPPKPSRGGFKGIWMVPANAKWPGRKPYKPATRKAGKKRRLVKESKNLQSDVENG